MVLCTIFLQLLKTLNVIFISISVVFADCVFVLSVFSCCHPCPLCPRVSTELEVISERN